MLLNQFHQDKERIIEIRRKVKDCNDDDKEHLMIDIAANEEILRGFKKDLGLNNNSLFHKKIACHE